MTGRRLALIVCGVGLYGQTPNVVLMDGDFPAGNWTSRIVLNAGSDATFTAVTEGFGGNPGAFRHVVHSFQGRAFTVSHLRLSGPELAYSPQTQGAIQSIRYSYDRKVISGGLGQRYQLALYQNGSTYAGSPVDRTDGITAWTTFTDFQFLQAIDFTKIDGPGPANPDFSRTGAQINFGYITSNPDTMNCDMYGCSPDVSAQRLDTGIDNLTVNIFTAAGPAGVSCAMTPQNRFIPFHRPEVHLADPSHHPNHRLAVLVTSDGRPVPGVTVNVSATRLALSLSPPAPPTLTMASAVTGADGRASVYHSSPPPEAFDRTDFTATGSVGDKAFSCTSSVTVGIGVLSVPLGRLLATPDGTILNPRGQLFALRGLLLTDRTLLAELESKAKYRPVVRKILDPQTAAWSIGDLKLSAEILKLMEEHAAPGLRTSVAGARQNLTDALKQGTLAREAAKLKERRRALDVTQREMARKQTLDKPAALPSTTTAARLEANYGKLPFSFEPNRGQTNRRVRYFARGQGFHLFLTHNEALLVNNPAIASPSGRPSLVRLWFPGASATQRIVPSAELAGKSNYIIGKNPARWHTNIPHYGEVKYEGLYPGVDLVFHGRGQELEFDFVVAPGGHPEQIKLALEGGARLEQDASGGVVFHHAAGRLRLHPPAIYQEIAGVRRRVEGRYIQRTDNELGFEIGNYDTGSTLVIDPVISYGSFLGGSGDDAGMAIAVDAQGNAYVTGSTSSINFPSVSAAQTNHAGGSALNMDAFVAKLNAAGTALVYSTYIGGSGQDIGMGIAVDSQGSAYVTGDTSSSDFPLAKPIQPVFGGGGGGVVPTDAFVVKLSPSGSSLVYSTYLGGAGDDVGRAVAVDSAGNAYVAGQTSSNNFPLKNALQNSNHGLNDAFVVKVNPAGTDFVYSTYLGGAGGDIANGVAADAAGNAYVTGITWSGDFPVAGAMQSALGGSADAFAAKINPLGSALVYSTYLGGSSDDFGMGIAVDAGGNAYLTGITGSKDFPLQNALQPKFGSPDLLGSDAYVAKLDPAGAHLVYSTYLGGKGADAGMAIAVGADGSAYVAGETDSADLPMANAIQSAGGSNDGFLAKLSPSGSTLTWSTFLGGSGHDSLAALAVDSIGNVYVTGSTVSDDFPVTFGAFQTGPKGQTDALVLKIVEGVNLPKVTTVSAASGKTGGVAAESIVSAYGVGLATTTQAATTLPLPGDIGGTSVKVKDSTGREQAAPLFFVSPGQINYLIPAGSANGLAMVTVTTAGKVVASGTVQIGPVAPGLFSANASGRGVAAALAVKVTADGTQTTQLIFQCGTTPGSCVATPINLGSSTDQVILLLFGTGIRGRSSQSGVSATLGGQALPVLFAGPQGVFAGLDQVNLGPLPRSLAGRGELDLVLTVDGLKANTVTVAIQ